MTRHSRQALFFGGPAERRRLAEVYDDSLRYSNTALRDKLKNKDVYVNAIEFWINHLQYYEKLQEALTKIMKFMEQKNKPFTDWEANLVVDNFIYYMFIPGPLVALQKPELVLLWTTISTIKWILDGRPEDLISVNPSLIGAYMEERHGLSMRRSR